MSTPIGLGIPDGPPPVLHPRRKTRQLQVGPVGVGSDSPISVQSMTNTKTHDINGTLQQIAQLTASGCDMSAVERRQRNQVKKCEEEVQCSQHHKEH